MYLNAQTSLPYSSTEQTLLSKSFNLLAKEETLALEKIAFTAQEATVALLSISLAAKLKHPELENKMPKNLKELSTSIGSFK